MGYSPITVKATNLHKEIIDKIIQNIAEDQTPLKLDDKLLQPGERWYEIWSEGYHVTGNKCGATYHGTFAGETFVEAVTNFKNSKESLKNDETLKPHLLVWWGCGLYDNEQDARKSFG